MILLRRRYIDLVTEFPAQRLRGEFNLTLKRGGIVRVDTGWFPNVITNIGLDRIGQVAPMNQPMIAGVAIGTGNSTPAFTDTQLQALSAWTTTSATVTGLVYGPSPTYYVTRQFGYAFPQGAVVGNMSEVGVGWANNSLFARSLIKDAGGNPTTLSITSLDQLDVRYKITMYPPLEDTSGTVNISGVDYSYQGRILNAGSSYWQFSNTGATYVGGAAAWTGVGGYGYLYPAGASLAAVTADHANNSGMEFMNVFSGVGAPSTLPAYVNGSYTQTVEHNWATGNANFAGGVGGYKLWEGMGGVYQCVWTPGIPKDNTKTLKLTRRVSWGRYP
jgi:hypothetical protein